MFWTPQMRRVLVVLLLLAGGSLPLLAEDPVLLYPLTTVFQLTLGVSQPVIMSKKGNLAFNYAFQFNYALPANLTQLTSRPAAVARSAREAPGPRSLLNLEGVYASLEELLERHGWENGRECLLRTICELASTPLARSGGDVLEEIIHLLLTRPSQNWRHPDYPGGRGGPYVEAELLGGGGGECAPAYGGCAVSPLEVFTEIA